MPGPAGNHSDASIRVRHGLPEGKSDSPLASFRARTRSIYERSSDLVHCPPCRGCYAFLARKRFETLAPRHCSMRSCRISSVKCVRRTLQLVALGSRWFPTIRRLTPSKFLSGNYKIQKRRRSRERKTIGNWRDFEQRS